MGPKRVKTEESSESGKAEQFNEDQRREILAYVKDNKEAILSTKNDCGTIENKNFLWGQLAQKLSAAPGGVIRTPASVRTKWNNMLKDARRDYKKIIIPPTGGGPKPTIRWESEYIIGEVGIDEPIDKGGIMGGIDTGDPLLAVPALESSAASSADEADGKPIPPKASKLSV